MFALQPSKLPLMNSRLASKLDRRHRNSVPLRLQFRRLRLTQSYSQCLLRNQRRRLLLQMNC